MKIFSFYFTTILFIFIIGIIGSLENNRDTLLRLASNNKLHNLNQLGQVFKDDVIIPWIEEKTHRRIEGGHSTRFKIHRNLRPLVFGYISPKMYMFVLRLVLLVSVTVASCCMIMAFRDNVL